MAAFKDETLEKLEFLEAEVIGLLKRAGKDKKSDFRLMQVATAGKDMMPQVRTVVMRELNNDPFSVGFHCDIRSEKIKNFRENPVAQLHFWSKGKSLQIRLIVQVRLITEASGSIFEEKLSKCSAKELLLYESSLPPREHLAEHESKVDVITNKNNIRSNFVWVDCRVRQMEILHLGRPAHTRALIDYQKEQRTFIKS
ncbi:MAG: pyridoxamine 5'-phosphate oxidase family protein [Cyclobacteriaceae bacterium]|nr:pyridoxamine 5'-phosphate oxidase family protein [Cyclobacteriaceae bacterium]MCH8514995.1 pyridoxamine 5'-phosphate oxidase family protein [Cyclobacteriaceae bacterium]